VNNTENVRNN